MGIVCKFPLVTKIKQIISTWLLEAWILVPNKTVMSIHLGSVHFCSVNPVLLRFLSRSIYLISICIFLFYVFCSRLKSKLKGVWLCANPSPFYQFKKKFHNHLTFKCSRIRFLEASSYRLNQIHLSIIFKCLSSLTF
jgi:hypothetical protein